MENEIQSIFTYIFTTPLKMGLIIIAVSSVSMIGTHIGIVDHGWRYYFGPLLTGGVGLMLFGALDALASKLYQ